VKTSIGTLWGVVFLALYLIFIFILAWQGHKKTKDMASFAIAKSTSPFLLAVVYAASFASSGTFVGITGNVYAAGFSGIWYSMCQWAPAVIGMAIIAKGYRKLSGKFHNLDIAGWLGTRYNSKTFSNYISVVTVLQVFQIAAQFAGCAIVGQALFGWGYQPAVILAVCVVMMYITLGGSYAHYYTNYFQGAIMAVLALVIFFAVWTYYPSNPIGNITSNLAAVDGKLVQWFNPDMADYSSGFIVISGLFVVHLFWGCNPHLISKLQSVQREKDLRKLLIWTGVLLFIFGLACQAGMISRIIDPYMEIMSSNDEAITFFLANRFPTIISGFGLLVIWAAAMSTTDGIVVLMSTVIANTFYYDWYAKPRVKAGKMSEETAQKHAFRWTTWATPLVCLVALALAWNQPKFMTTMIWIASGGILGATVGPVICGIYMKKASLAGAWIGSISGITSFFILFFYRASIGIGIFTACSYACVISLVVSLVACKFVGKPVDQKLVSEMFDNNEEIKAGEAAAV